MDKWGRTRECQLVRDVNYPLTCSLARGNSSTLVQSDCPTCTDAPPSAPSPLSRLSDQSKSETDNAPTKSFQINIFASLCFFFSLNLPQSSCYLFWSVSCNAIYTSEIAGSRRAVNLPIVSVHSSFVEFFFFLKGITRPVYRPSRRWSQCTINFNVERHRISPPPSLSLSLSLFQPLVTLHFPAFNLLSLHFILIRTRMSIVDVNLRDKVDKKFNSISTKNELFFNFSLRTSWTISTCDYSRQKTKK